jgi:ketosteroid isomerase-like protein
MRLDHKSYAALMQQLAVAWSTQDTESGLACFTEDAIYMEPPDLQLFLGHEQLRPYFGALTPGYFMQFHNLWFDEPTQTGTGKYSFGNEERDYSLHGVCVTEIRDGRIAFWREYQRKGPKLFEDFINKNRNDWQNHG